MKEHRKIGPFLATMLVASSMIGSGIFLLPATLATIGSITLIGWLIATAGALLIAVVLAKLAQTAPAAAGLCAYAGEALGPYMGFQSSAIYWLGCWTGNLAIAIGATGYLAHFFPVLAAPLPAACVTIALLWTTTLLNIVGPRLVCQCDSVALIFGVIPILLVALAGWWFFDPQLFRASWNVQHLPAYRAIPDSLVMVFWAFLGLESGSIATSVVENPRRNVPLAIVCGVLIAAAIYMGSCAAIMGLIPAQRLAASTAPFTDAVRLMLGPFAGACVNLMALVKIFGTLLGWMLLTAEMGRAGAQRGQFPRVFGRVDRRGVPVAGLLIVAAASSVIALVTMSPTLAEQFGKVVEVTVILSLLNYLYACPAVWHYARSPALAPAARASLRRYQPAALLAMLFCLGVIVRSDMQLLALAVIVVFLTYPVYPFVIKHAQPPPA